MVLQIVIRDVKGDGSCFFRALYNSALRTGNLTRIMRRLRITDDVRMAINKDGMSTAEDAFVRSVRRFLSEFIIGSHTIREIYTYLKGIRETDKMTYYAILESYPSWFQNKFMKHKLPSSCETFATILSQQVLKMTNWVSEIEVRLVLENLRRIPITILNNLPTVPKRIACDEIYIFNQGEFHYKYILCRDCRPKLLNPPTKRCVDKNGAVGKRLLTTAHV